MKKILSILCLALCLCTSCERDNDGNVLHYFKTEGHGYAFYRLPDGMLIPCSNQDVIVENFIRSGHSFWAEYEAHFDHVTTDANGYFTCRFLKKLGTTEIKEHFVYLGKVNRDDNNFFNVSTLPEHSYLHGYDGYCEISHETLKNSKDDIFLDTLFIEVKVSLSYFFDDFESGSFDLWEYRAHDNFWTVNNCSTTSMPAYSGINTAKNLQSDSWENVLRTPRLFIKPNTKLEFFYRSEYGGIHDSQIQIEIAGIGSGAPRKLLWTSTNTNLTANVWNKISIDIEDYIGRNDIFISFKRERGNQYSYDVIEIDDVKIFQ
jgi:hypothetical protein